MKSSGPAHYSDLTSINRSLQQVPPAALWRPRNLLRELFDKEELALPLILAAHDLDGQAVVAVVADGSAVAWCGWLLAGHSHAFYAVDWDFVG